MKTAQTSRQYNAIDAATFFCAILIVTIHFPPLGNAAVSPLAQAVNSFFRSYLGRIAVPFFLLSAGFFLFRKTASQPFSAAPSKAYVLRILRLYVLWTILYLPWIIREARESGKNLLTGLLSFLRNFLLTGSYSHLWYLPALAVAAALVGWLLRKGLRPGYILAASALLYCIGLLGQGWFFLLRPLQGTALYSLLRLYEKIFTTTRNGLFFGFPYVAMGMYLAYHPSKLSKRRSGVGFLISMVLLYLEVSFTRSKGEAPGTDMYLFLLPAAYLALVFLMQLSPKSRPCYRTMRKLSLLLYLTHIAVNKIFVLPIVDHMSPACNAAARFPLTLALSLGISLLILKLSQQPHFQWLQTLYQ